MTVRSAIDAAEPPSHRVRVTVRVRVPLRDGTQLAAVLYLPRDADGGVPFVVEITPYGRDTCHADAIRIADAGFGFLAVDCRGRGDSAGTFAQMVHDGADGYDVVEWVASQPYCSGDVAMWGGSYTGMNQWATAAHHPPHLRAIAPGMSAVLGLDSPRGGIPALWELAWLLLVDQTSMAPNLSMDTALLQAIVAEHRASGRPDSDLPAIIGFDHPEFDRVATMPEWGPHWEALLPTAEGFAGITIPVLSITGQHDNAQHGALLHHERFLQAASSAVRSTSHLVIGPWDHASAFTGGDRVGDLQFDDAAAVDVCGLMIEWFGSVMAGGDRPAFLEAPCLVYVAGAEEWRGYADLAAATATTMSLALHSPGARHDIFHSGWLDASPAAPAVATFRCGPDHEPTTRLERTARPEADGGVVNSIAAPTRYHNLFDHTGGDDPTDQAFSVAIDGIGVAYHSAPFAESLDLVGRPELDLWLSIENPATGAMDADLAVLLAEVRPDGTAITSSSQIVRLSTIADDLADGRPQRVSFAATRFFARRLAVGSRLRLVIRATNSLYVAAPQGDVTVAVHHGPDHPSGLRLPIAHDPDNDQETP